MNKGLFHFLKFLNTQCIKLLRCKNNRKKADAFKSLSKLPLIDYNW